MRVTPSFLNNKTKFKNNQETPDHGLWELLKWKLESIGVSPEFKSFPLAENDPEYLKQNRTDTNITWIGHSTFLLQHGGTNIITDPHMTRRTSPVDWAGPLRTTPPGLDFEDLPEIDIVLISHNHYDHMDRETVKRLYHRQPENPPLFIVPLDVKKWFLRQDMENVVEMGWWEDFEFDGWHIHFVPAQHFSSRGLFDHNRTLWGGFVMEKDDYSVYFAGDTGYSDDFEEIGRRLGPMDLSLIPIGAYKPRWFQKSVHVSPKEAVKIHQDVRSKFSIGMHWGTFILSDEELDEPPRKLEEEVLRAGLDDNEFITVKHGETKLLDAESHSQKVLGEEEEREAALQDE